MSNKVCYLLVAPGSWPVLHTGQQVDHGHLEDLLAIVDQRHRATLQVEINLVGNILENKAKVENHYKNRNEES